MFHDMAIMNRDNDDDILLKSIRRGSMIGDNDVSYVFFKIYFNISGSAYKV